MDKRLLAEAQVAWGLFAFSVSLSVIIGVVVVAQAFLLSRIITRVFLESQQLADVAGYLAALAFMVFLRAVCSGFQHFVSARLALKVRLDLRQRLLAHIVALGPAYTRGQRSGEISLALTEGVDTLDAYFRDYLPGIFTALLVPLLILLLVFPIDILTFIVLLVTAPLIPVFMVLIGMAAGALARRQYGSMSRMSAHFLDVLQGLTTLKLFNRSRAQIETIGRITDQFRQTTMSVLRVAFMSAFALELLSTLSVAVVAVEIGLRLLAGTIGFEQALFLLVIAPEFYLPLRMLGVKFHAGTESAAAADRIYEVLNTEPAPDGDHSVPVPQRMVIRFENVSYAFEDGARRALDSFSMVIEPGQHVAMVGASGSGKSTVANLLLRFLVAQSGQVLIDGVDLVTLNADRWREQVAWVPQQPYLFYGTVAENIRLGKAGASDEAVVEAAQLADAHDFIMALPQGYDTPIGERGMRLSGGQAQRLAIARAFLKDAPLLILDEATANLDPDTEAMIEESLQRLLKGRTALMIAHRLNTVLRADRIAVVDEGRVVEYGDHASLIAEAGTYAQLVRAFGRVSHAEI